METAMVRTEIALEKRKAWNSFLSTMDYRTDSTKTHELILNNRNTVLILNPITVNIKSQIPRK